MTAATLADLEEQDLERDAIQNESPPANDHAPTAWDGRIVPAPSEWYTTRPPARDWLLRDKRVANTPGVLPRGRVGLVVAEGGAGKTMAFCQLAVSLETGAPWLGAYVPPAAATGRVLALLGEETEDECHRRLYRARAAMGCAVPRAGAIVCMPLAGVECALLSTGPTGDPVETDFARWLVAHVERERYLAVLIDPHARFGGREAELANGAATRAVQIYEAIAATGASVLVAHHTAQWDRRTRDPSSSSARGVTALTDGARWMLHLGCERLDGVEEHLRELVTATVTKSNYAARGEPIVLRRAKEHGGALVAVLDDELEAIHAARGGTGERAEREAARQTERQAQVADDDAAVRTILAREPDISWRRLRAEVKQVRACGTGRADEAIARVRGDA